MPKSSRKEMTHPYAPFLYGRYFWKGDISRSELIVVKGQKDLSGNLADHIMTNDEERYSSFETKFRHIRKALTLKNDAQGLKHCAAAVCHWNKHLEFRLDQFSPNKGAGYGTYYNMRDPLIQALAFVQTVLHQLGYSGVLPVRRPLFDAVRNLQCDQYEIVQEYMEKFGRRATDTPKMGSAFTCKPAI